MRVRGGEFSIWALVLARELLILEYGRVRRSLDMAAADRGRRINRLAVDWLLAVPVDA